MGLMHVQRFQSPLAHITIGVRRTPLKFRVRETLGGESITQAFKFILRDAAMSGSRNAGRLRWGRRGQGLRWGRWLQRGRHRGRVRSRSGVRDRDGGWSRGRRWSRFRSRFRGRSRGSDSATTATTTGQRHDERYGGNETCESADPEKHMRGGQKRGKEGAPLTLQGRGFVL